jgi:DNA modification methylase
MKKTPKTAMPEALPASGPPIHCAHDALVPLAKLKPHPRNPHTHPKAQVAILAKIIQYQGWRSPIVVSKRSGLIVAGHGRLEAARALGLAAAPVNHQAFATEADEIAHLVADNQIAELADMGEDGLKALLSEMAGLNFDLELMGFDAAALHALLNGSTNDVDAEPRIDQAAELRKKWAVDSGDLWALGEHRMLCGDATKGDDVKRLLGVDRPNLMVTDPPYGVEYDAEWRDKYALKTGNFVGWQAKGKVANDERVDWTAAWELFQGAIVYCWHADRYASSVQRTLEAVGFTIRSQIIWAKQAFVFGRGDYHRQHEPCWYAVRGTGKWVGDRKQTTLWEINNNNAFSSDGTEKRLDHSTQKPVECMQRPLLNHTVEGDYVYDPFVGSGTTIIAAERTARRCLAIEIMPEYVAVTLERYLEATGKTPTRIE